MTKIQFRLKKLYGTPQEFERSVAVACNRILISKLEYEDAVKKYRNEWEAAGQKIEVKKSKSTKLNLEHYKTLYENLSKRISRLHAYADRTGNRVLKNIAFGQPDYHGS